MHIANRSLFDVAKKIQSTSRSYQHHTRAGPSSPNKRPSTSCGAGQFHKTPGTPFIVCFISSTLQPSTISKMKSEICCICASSSTFHPDSEQHRAPEPLPSDEGCCESPSPRTTQKPGPVPLCAKVAAERLTCQPRRWSRCSAWES